MFHGRHRDVDKFGESETDLDVKFRLPEPFLAADNSAGSLTPVFRKCFKTSRVFGWATLRESTELKITSHHMMY